jgi:hypothetical protein
VNIELGDSGRRLLTGRLFQIVLLVVAIPNRRGNIYLLKKY